MNIGIDHGYYAIKTRHCSFPAGLTTYGSHEPYTRQGLLESGRCFFCLRNRTAADPARQNHQRQLLPADDGCIGARNPQPRRTHRVYGADRGGAAADQLWPGQAEVSQLPAPSFPAGPVPLRGCGVQHHHSRCAAVSPGLCRPDG